MKHSESNKQRDSAEREKKKSNTVELISSDDLRKYFIAIMLQTRCWGKKKRIFREKEGENEVIGEIL